MNAHEAQMERPTNDLSLQKLLDRLELTVESLRASGSRIDTCLERLRGSTPEAVDTAVELERNDNHTTRADGLLTKLESTAARLMHASNELDMYL